MLQLSYMNEMKRRDLRHIMNLKALKKQEGLNVCWDANKMIRLFAIK